MSDENNTSTTKTSSQGRHLHDPHDHKPTLKFGDLFKTTGKFTCEVCEEPIVYTKPWYIANRVWYYIFFAFLIYTVLNNRSVTSEAMLLNFAMIIGALVIYLLGAALINRKGAFEIDEKMIAALAAKQTEESGVAAPEETSAQAEEAVLSEEQAELQALYQHYARLNAEANGETVAEASTGDAASDSIAAEVLPLADTCEHELVSTWKNFVPGMMEFTCAHCGTKLTFPAELKKRINMIFLAISLVMIIPMMNFEKVSFLAFVGLTLLVLVLATLMQVYLVKRTELVPV